MRLQPFFTCFSGVLAIHRIASCSLGIWPNKSLPCFPSSRLAFEEIGEMESVSPHAPYFLHIHVHLGLFHTGRLL